jgi:hypothetical protein
MTIEEITRYEKTFYTYWEKVLDNTPDEVLEASAVLIKMFKSPLNDLIAEQAAFRASLGEEE